MNHKGTIPPVRNPRTAWWFSTLLAVLLSLSISWSCSSEKLSPEASTPSGGTQQEASDRKESAPQEQPRPEEAPPKEGPEGKVGESPPTVLEELEQKLRHPGPAVEGSVAVKNKTSEAFPEKESEELLKALQTRIHEWVAALDKADLKGLQSLFLTDKELESLVPKGHYDVLSGHLFAKNLAVLERLLESAKGQEVKINQWSPGPLRRTTEGKSLFRGTFPLVSSSRLEISLGGIPVELEFRHALKITDGWKLLEVAVKG